jgi:kinesin family protein C2/C3
MRSNGIQVNEKSEEFIQQRADGDAAYDTPVTKTGGNAAVEKELAMLRKENRMLKDSGGGGGSSADPELHTKIEALEDEKGALLELLKEAQKELTERQDNPTGTTSSGGASSAEMMEIKTQLQEQKKQVASLNRQLEDGANSENRASNDDGASERANQLQKEVQSLQAELSAAKAEGGSASQASEAAVGAVRAELEQAKADKEAAEKAKADLAVEMETQLAAQSEQLMEEMVKEIEATETKAEEDREALASQLQKLQGSSSNMKSGLKNVQRAMVAMKSQHSSMREAIVAELGSAPKFTDAGSQIVAQIIAQAASMKEVVANYRKEMKERKRLFNLVQELRGNIRVFCRVRPVNPREIAEGGTVIAKFPDEDEIAMTNERGKLKQWGFDKVFAMDSTQEQVFKEAEGLITSVLDGYNVCLFAYGQTGSGKTFTMSGPPDNRGLNLRSLQSLFLLKNGRTKEYTDKIHVTLLEIYNESIRDLLAETVGDRKLSVKQGEYGMYVPELTEVPVESIEEVIELMELGEVNRSSTATDMNEHSSRSHSMLSVYIESHNRVTGNSSRGKLHLVDLAGSERISKSGATGVQLKEAQNINKSLSALGDVVASRVAKQSHTPYRNSTLTYLLQDSLEKDSKTLMLCCVSPASFNSEESFCTLNFAARARAVELGKVSGAHYC